MVFQLRPYQQDAIAKVRRHWQEHDTTLLVMPTGTGKTEVFVNLMKNSPGRALVICPMITLITQAADKIYARTGMPPAIEQASNWANEHPDVRCPFIVGSKQTLAPSRKGTPRYRRFKDITQVYVDEAHLSLTKPYVDMLDYFRTRGAKILGVTATPKRHDKQAMGKLFESCAFHYGIKDAVDDGWLVDAKVRACHVQSMDLSDVSTNYRTTWGKDFSPTELNRILESEATIFEISEITARETGKEKTVIFCSSVREAQLVAERLKDRHKLNAAWICADTGKLPAAERKRIEAGFKDRGPGCITHLANVGILTTGWDYPWLKNIVMARPTQSLSLYTQVYGRGTRPLPGIVDFAGSTSTTRKGSIMFSDKPHFRMFDLVDASLTHKIVTAVDVLGGEHDEEVIANAKRRMVKDDKITPQEALDAAEKEEQLRRDAVMEAAKAHEAKVAYRKMKVSQYEQFNSLPESEKDRKTRNSRMPYGKYKGTKISALPGYYLRWVCKHSKGWVQHAAEKAYKERMGGR